MEKRILNRGKKYGNFRGGVVKHIHGCYADRGRECVYILTGDENKESGIWKATDNFTKVEPLLLGSQQFRTCQMNFIGSDLYYFTDAPSENNYMYRYTEGKIERICRLKGTCIWGCNFQGGGFYSTTCEPNKDGKNKIDYWLTNKSGNGVVGNTVEVFAVNNEWKIEGIIKFEHDGFPLRLFQYGTVAFTNAMDKKTYFTPLCVKKYDMSVFEITEES